MVDPLTPSEVDSVRALDGRLGTTKAAKLLGIGRPTVLAIICGKSVHNGTVLCVREGLASPEAANGGSHG